MDLGLKPVRNVLKDTGERKREDLVKVNTHSLSIPLCISLPLPLFSLLQILMSVMMRILLLIAAVVLIVLINQDHINVKVNV